MKNAEQYYHVLLIEDENIARKQLARAIKKEGFKVTEAENGRIGLEIFRKETPDIIITDIKMPEMDGLEVMHTARSLSRNVQIIMISGHGEFDAALAALREGALDYLKKPLDLDQLSLALGRAREKIKEYHTIQPFPMLLLADDDVATRKRLARVLEDEGWPVYQADNGEEAIAIFAKYKIDIALLDINMPKMDGLQTLHSMRTSSDDFEAIILTGFGDEANATQALRDGAINFLKKPIDLDQLTVSVEKAIEKLETERSLKYRIRELELSQQVIARVTADKDIIIDIRGNNRIDAMAFAKQILDSLPLDIVLFGIDRAIIYISPALAKVLDHPSDHIDAEFVTALNGIGIELDFEALTSAADEVFQSPAGKLITITTGKFSYLTLLVTIIGLDPANKIMFMSVRGERGSNT